MKGKKSSRSVSFSLPKSANTSQHFSSEHMHNQSSSKRHRSSSADSLRSTPSNLTCRSNIRSGNDTVNDSFIDSAHAINHNKENTFIKVTEETTLAEMLNIDQNQKLGKLENKLFHEMYIRKKNESERNGLQKGVVQVKTQGTPIHLVHAPVPKPGKDSSNVCSPTKRYRSSFIQNFTSVVAGSNQNPEALNHQVASGLKHMPQVTKENVAKMAGIEMQKKLDEIECSHLTVTLGLSERQYFRQLKPFLKEKGLSTPSLEKMKEFNKQLANDYKIIEVELEVKDDTVKDTKYIKKKCEAVVVSNFVDFVKDIVNRYEKAGLLHFEGELEHKVGIKIGGDFGQDTFKFMLQIANVEGCNSRGSTHIFCMTEEKDTYNNLKTLSGYFAEAIQDLQNMPWKDDITFDIFVFGDLAFLCAIFGHTGGASTYPCIFLRN